MLNSGLTDPDMETADYILAQSCQNMSSLQVKHIYLKCIFKQRSGESRH